MVCGSVGLYSSGNNKQAEYIKDGDATTAPVFFK
jgi:hypothetical protein